MVALGHYRHFKGGDYHVIGIAKHADTEEPVVVYRCLYGEFRLWYRPVENFTETVIVDGKSMPRFTFIAAI